MKYYFYLITICLWSLGCTREDGFNFDTSYDQSYLDGMTILPKNLASSLEGIYVGSSNAGIGKNFVVKYTDNKLSIFSNQDGIYIVLDAAMKNSDSSVRLAGYWRSPLTPSFGTIYLELKTKSSIGQLNQLNKQDILIEGDLYRDGSKKSISLKFSRNFSDKVAVQGEFVILAHRGGGRNSDYLPYAENSLQLMKRASYMGATGIEIDVKITKDKIPIIYHDDDINTRLTQKSPVFGKIEDFNYGFLKNFVTLVDGQQIPSMEEALNLIIDSTNLTFVWLDNKGGTEDFFTHTLPVMYRAVLKARSLGRKLVIVNGIPTEEVEQEFMKIPYHKDRLSMSEISLESAIKIGSEVYAPRWTLGTLEQEVSAAHAKNFKVITWTVDLEAIMRKFLEQGNFDGILTNYPSILAYHYYSQE